MKLRVEMSGAPTMRRLLRQLSDPAVMAKVAGEALHRAGEAIIAEAKRRVPVDTGVLRDSGYVLQPQMTPDGVVVEIGFGGPGAEYAIIVHEDLTMRHPSGGQAKYLESAIRDRASQTGRILADGVRRALQRL